VETLKETPIRNGANTVLDQEMKDMLSVVVEMTRGTLSWSTEARLSLKDIQTLEMDSF
jgi:hypothetical protein